MEILWTIGKFEYLRIKVKNLKFQLISDNGCGNLVNKNVDLSTENHWRCDDSIPFKSLFTMVKDKCKLIYTYAEHLNCFVFSQNQSDVKWKVNDLIFYSHWKYSFNSINGKRFKYALIKNCQLWRKLIIYYTLYSQLVTEVGIWKKKSL